MDDESSTGLDPSDRSWSVGRSVLIGLAIVLGLVAGAVALWSLTGDATTDVRDLQEDREESVPRGAGADTTGQTKNEPSSTATDATGLVRVRLEPVDGMFTEGFEVGLRFETAGGEVIASTHWSDFVRSQGAQGIEAFYESVLEQEVPAGPTVVRAEVDVGAGPAPSIPDLRGDLSCRVDLDVAPGATEEVEVSFDGTDGCLHRVDPATPPVPR